MQILNEHEGGSIMHCLADKEMKLRTWSSETNPKSPLVELTKSVLKTNSAAPVIVNMANMALNHQDLAWEYHQELDTIIVKSGFNKSCSTLLVFWNILLSCHLIR